MNEIAIAVLSLSCAVLCVGVAGLLRRIADVKLTLGGYNGETSQFMIDIGRRLPDAVIDELVDPNLSSLILIGSRSCDACHEVIEELGPMIDRVTVGVIAGEGAELDTGDALLLTEQATEVLVREFDLSQIPVAIAQQDGYVTGAAYGDALTAEGGLHRFWSTLVDEPVEVHA